MLFACRFNIIEGYGRIGCFLFENLASYFFKEISYAFFEIIECLFLTDKLEERSCKKPDSADENNKKCNNLSGREEGDTEK